MPCKQANRLAAQIGNAQTGKQAMPPKQANYQCRAIRQTGNAAQTGKQTNKQYGANMQTGKQTNKQYGANMQTYNALQISKQANNQCFANKQVGKQAMLRKQASGTRALLD